LAASRLSSNLGATKLWWIISCKCKQSRSVQSTCILKGTRFTKMCSSLP
jgi:hypothetical protein